MKIIYGGTYTLPPAEKLRVGDQIALDARRAWGDKNDAVTVFLNVEDVYEAAPGAKEVTFTVLHPFIAARCEVEYDPRTGATDVTIYVDEE